MHVVIVDDEREILALCRRAFALYAPDAGVETHEGGRAALRAPRSAIPDVVVSDHRMPDMTGVAFLAECAKRWPHARRALITGCQEVSIAIEAVNHGHVHAILSKPISPRQLVDRVVALGKDTKAEAERRRAPAMELARLARAEQIHRER